MTEIDPQTDGLVPSWLTLPDVAERLGVEVTRVRQLLREGQLLAVRRGENRTLQVPEAFLDEGHLLKGLPGTLMVLSDAGFDEAASLRWLFTDDPTLPGSPVTALAEGRRTEVNRRAQAMAL